MSHQVYSTPAWRALPRTGTCALADLLPDDCSSDGVLHRHHVRPISAGGDPLGQTVLVCTRHHPMLEAMARKCLRWKRCNHVHRYPGAREACERRLNSL